MPASPTVVLFLLALFALVRSTTAVFVNFNDCLERYTISGTQIPYIGFTPMYVWASFNTSSPDHTLNLTIYGNVTGQDAPGSLPSPSDTAYWTDPNKTLGKIIDVWQPNNKFTTLFANFRVLSYSAWNSPSQQFCANLVNATCPVAPAFHGNSSDPTTLPAFTLAHDFGSSYSFATLEASLRIAAGNAEAISLGCVTASITPALGSKLENTLCYLPAAILMLMAAATIFAATRSPWGTSNLFRWSSNYGRDEDLLRLVTPGFGDCLQYIQFIVLSGSLSLNYPGFYQPVISQASWSLLLFNQSFVSKGNGTQSLVDGLYSTNGTYGLTRLGEYVGISEESDIWACMAVFLLVLITITVLIVQLGFLGRWLFRFFTHTQDGDLTGKNWPFTAGIIVRILLNYFMLPLVALSFFQLVVAARSPASVVSTAAIMLALVVGAAVWIFWLIFTTRPRAHLFDDLPTVLTYGPLYNTYSDDAAPFAFIPVLLTVIRGIAIGAIQPSGIAQVIILAICEVILILTLHAFRPFQSNTSMNAYHTFFSAIRLACVLLSVAFVPSLSVGEAPRGWIGYTILLLHAMVLVFGFFLNALQTIIEVVARLGGAGADQRGGLTTVFGKRQLSKRNVNRHHRSSLNSNAAMLTHDDNKHIQRIDSRSRSLSASSGVLLSQPYDRDSSGANAGFDQYSQGGYSYTGGTSPGTPGVNPQPFNFLGGASAQSSRRPTMGGGLEPADPYYRPPRARKPTLDSILPDKNNRTSASADIADRPIADADLEAGDGGEGPSRGSVTPAPAYLRLNRDDSDPDLERRNKTDYSVRESDLVYGLRRHALSDQQHRKLKTGPADPMSPVSSAAGWFKSLSLISGRKKEKSKGFEVVRSTRMPPQMEMEEEGEPTEAPREPYHDSPPSPPRPKTAESHSVATADVLTGGRGNLTDSESEMSDVDFDRGYRVPATAPTLGPIETGGGIELPSRIGSRASRVTQTQGPPSRVPSIPRRNSRRTRSTEAAVFTNRLSTVIGSPATPRFAPTAGTQHLQPSSGGALPLRLPFGSTDPSPSPERSPERSRASSIYPDDVLADFAPPPRMGAQADRPLSTGYVQHHKTQDSVQHEGYAPGSHLEASAEIVDRTRSMDTRRSSRSRRSRS